MAARKGKRANFKFAHIGVDELVKYPDAINDIYTRKLDIMVVKGVFSRAHMEKVVAALEDPKTVWEKTLQETLDPKQKQFYLLGESLTPYAGHPDGPDLDHYHQAAATLRAQVKTLFAGGPDFEPRVEEIFRKIAGGRKVEIPASQQRGPYAGETIRALPQGTEIPVHVGNYFLETKAYVHLSTLVTLEDQLSYFVVMRKPDEGGELIVYTLEYPDPEAPVQDRAPRSGWDDDDRGAKWPSQGFAPETGDLLLFDGGRYYHRVSRVTSAATRWTIGGFLGFSKGARDTVYYWS
jgi:hypothetical protein